MIKEQGRVIKLKGDCAEVAVSVQGSCARCGAASICDWTCRRERVVLARNPIGAQPGQIVIITRRQEVSLRSALLVFGVPAVLMITGVVLGSLFRSDWLGVMLAGAGLLAGGLVLFLVDRCRKVELPVISTRIAESKKGGQDDESDLINDNNHGIDHGNRSESAGV